MAIKFRKLEMMAMAMVKPTKVPVGISVTLEYEFYKIAVRKMVVIQAMQQVQMTRSV